MAAGKALLRVKEILKNIGKRAVAMGWVIDPDRFKIDGDARQSPSLRQLSKQLGFTAPTISPITSEFSRMTKIFNKFQDHDWRKEKHNDENQDHEDKNTKHEGE